MAGCMKKEKKKIHFNADVSLESNAIDCHSISNDECRIDLGLLSALHTYEVHFKMPHELGDEIQLPSLQTPNVEVVSVERIEGGCGSHIKLQVKCMEDAKLNETICFENSNGKKHTLKMISRVMPHHLGTPSLKSGIRLLHGAPDTMSDVTDWKGFE